MANALQRRVRRLPFLTLPRTFDDFDSGLRQLTDTMLDPTFFDPSMSVEPVGLFPAVEITESAEEFTATAELPGLEPKDVQLSFENGMLQIKGEKKNERETQNKKFHVFERAYGSFQRSFTFPADVKADKITAEFKDGLLTIHVPIAAKPESKASKITITAK